MAPHVCANSMHKNAARIVPPSLLPRHIETCTTLAANPEAVEADGLR